MFGANILNDDGRLLLSSAADAFMRVSTHNMRVKWSVSSNMSIDNFGRFATYFNAKAYPVGQIDVYVRVHPDVTTPPIVAFRVPTAPALSRGGYSSVLMSRSAQGEGSGSWQESHDSYAAGSINCLGYTRYTNTTLPAGINGPWNSMSGNPGDHMYVFHFATFYRPLIHWRAYAAVPERARDMSQTNGMEIYNSEGKPTFTSRPSTQYYLPEVMQVETAVKLNPPTNVAHDNSMSPIRGENTVSVGSTGSRWMAFSGDGILTHKSGEVQYDQTSTKRKDSVCIGVRVLGKCAGGTISTTTTDTTKYYFQSHAVYCAGVTPWVYSGGKVYYTPIPLRVGRALSTTKSRHVSGNALTQFLSGASLNNMLADLATTLVDGLTAPLKSYMASVSEQLAIYNSVGKIPVNHKTETRNDVLYILRE